MHRLLEVCAVVVGVAALAGVFTNAVTHDAVDKYYSTKVILTRSELGEIEYKVSEEAILFSLILDKPNTPKDEICATQESIDSEEVKAYIEPPAAQRIRDYCLSGRELDLN